MRTFGFAFGGLLLCALASMGASLAAVATIGTAANAERIPIYFPAGTPRLTQEAEDVLDEAVNRAHDLRSSRIVIVGYAPANLSRGERANLPSAQTSLIRDSLIDRGISPGTLYVMVSAATPEPDSAAPSFIAERRADIIIERSRAGF